MSMRCHGYSTLSSFANTNVVSTLECKIHSTSTRKAGRISAIYLSRRRPPQMKANTHQAKTEFRISPIIDTPRPSGPFSSITSNSSMRSRRRSSSYSAQLATGSMSSFFLSYSSTECVQYTWNRDRITDELKLIASTHKSAQSANAPQLHDTTPRPHTCNS